MSELSQRLRELLAKTAKEPGRNDDKGWTIFFEAEAELPLFIGANAEVIIAALEAAEKGEA